MSDVVIRVEKLGKLYRIGRQERYRTLRDTLVEGAGRSLRAVRSLFSRDGARGQEEPTIWALKDVSFEVKRGEVVGIIGRNGAGKSTLLKILSRVTEPSEGWAEVRGRVGSLLEVGTGFHPELTGRENIYLNGAILGMKRAEIARKFDEIVAFAEVEKFIDTPVKHYSSGMYLRLAFAVAAHLEPEILLVDEVLAVGDAAFQKKCLGKMGEVAGQGRTVLFVSHNMTAVSHLCGRCMLISHGRTAKIGEPAGVIAEYLRALQPSQHTLVRGRLYEGNSDELRLDRPCVTRVELLDPWDRLTARIETGSPVKIRVHYRSPMALRAGSVIVEIRDCDQRRLAVFDSGLSLGFDQGDHAVDCEISTIPLAAGDFLLGVGLAQSRYEWFWRRENLASIRIEPVDIGKLGRPLDVSRCLLAIPCRWRRVY